MANVTPGYTFTGATDTLTYSKLNLLGQPTVTIGTSEVTNTNLASSGGIGYVAGTGGTVTQSTNKTTAVTLNFPTGQITMNNASLASGATASFTLNNTTVAATDLLVLGYSGGTAGAYKLNFRCSSGSAIIDVTNTTGGALAEAIVISYGLLKGVTS